MRIAVAQLAIEPAMRTLTFQRALRAIDAAAETDPSPDVVLLPAFCDVPEVLAGNTEIVERLAGPTVAACGLRARHWGVFVALGFAEQGPREPYVTGVLLDNDGDVCVAHRQRRFSMMSGDGFSTGTDVCAADVVLGRLAVLTGDDVLDDEAWDAAARAGAAVILGTTCWGRGQGKQSMDVAAVRGQIADHAKHYGLPCAVADVMASDANAALTFPGMSTIANADGRILAAGEIGEATILWGDLDLQPASPTTIEDAE